LTHPAALAGLSAAKKKQTKREQKKEEAPEGGMIEREAVGGGDLTIGRNMKLTAYLKIPTQKLPEESSTVCLFPADRVISSRILVLSQHKTLLRIQWVSKPSTGNQRRLGEGERARERGFVATIPCAIREL